MSSSNNNNNNNNSAPSASNPPRGVIAAVCISVAIIATLLWTGLIYLLWRKRQQRQLKQHKRQNSLLDPSGAPRNMDLETGMKTGDTQTMGGERSLHQRTPSKLVVTMTPTTMVSPMAFDQRSVSSSYTVPPPPIPDEPIELMDKHYSQQFGKFKAVQWEGHGNGH